jgi:phospholipase/carboxylesterase
MKKSVLMMHGYGATAEDLAFLKNEVAIGQEIDWYFLDGPNGVPFFSGRSWFAIDFDEIDHSGGNFSDKRPEGIDAAIEYVIKFIKEKNISVPHLIIGGFSQGAMVALEVALCLEESVAGIIFLSGTLVDAQNIRAKASSKKALPLLQLHGFDDGILSITHAQKLAPLLEEAGWEVEAHYFKGGHTIPLQGLSWMSQFINSI